LELDGDVNTFCNRLESIGGMTAFERRGDFTVEISFISEISILKAIQDVTGLIVKCNLDLISMNSSTSRIEDAFLKLLEEEESRGFTRAI